MRPRICFALGLATTVGCGIAACSGSGSVKGTGGSGGATTTTSVTTSSNASSSSGSSSSGTTSSGGPTCYDGGTPMTTSDFLNPCEPAGMTCVTFSGTIPGLTADGGLPALP